MRKLIYDGVDQGLYSYPVFTSFIKQKFPDAENINHDDNNIFATEIYYLHSQNVALMYYASRFHAKRHVAKIDLFGSARKIGKVEKIILKEAVKTKYLKE